jgi:type II secretory pathway pseudopilin PulG
MKVRDEKGQALILALAFMMFFGLIIGVLLSLASSSVLSSSQLREQRSTVYAADGATDAAIQVALKNIGIGAYGDPRCVGSNPTTVGSTVMLTTTATTTDATTTSVVCTWSQDFLAPDRTVTFTTFVAGTAAPVVQATVLFHDHWSPVTAEVQSWVYCGHGGAC